MRIMGSKMILEIKNAMAVLDATRLNVTDDYLNSNGLPQHEQDSDYSEFMAAFSLIKAELQRQLDQAIDGHNEMQVDRDRRFRDKWQNIYDRDEQDLY